VAIKLTDILAPILLLVLFVPSSDNAGSTKPAVDPAKPEIVVALDAAHETRKVQLGKLIRVFSAEDLSDSKVMDTWVKAESQISVDTMKPVAVLIYQAFETGPAAMLKIADQLEGANAPDK
jgi:hypothetical protein